MIKIKFFFLFFISFFFKTQTTEKQLSSDDIKNLATEIFNQYIATTVKIRAEKPKPTKKEILTTLCTILIAPALSIWIGYKLIHINFSNLIQNIFTFKNSLKIDRSKQNLTLPHYLEEIKFDNQQDKFFLFYGPPGTGKTFGASVLVAKKNAFLKETDGNIFNVETFIGTDITKINNFFNELEALSSKNPKQKIVALIDEFESVGDRDQTNRDDKNTINCAVNLMLNKMDIIKRKFKNIYIIFTTNYKHNIDKALLTRCTVQVPFELPSINMINDMLKKNFENIQEINENKKDYIELIKNNINEESKEKKNLSINNLIIESSNYDEKTHDFWFGSLDFEIFKTNIESSNSEVCGRGREDKKEILSKKSKILSNYKTELNKEKDFCKFFAILAHLHEFNLRDINSLIEKKDEIRFQDHFIKIFSNKIRYKGFIRKKIDINDKVKIILNAKETSFNNLEEKINTLEANLTYS